MKHKKTVNKRNPTKKLLSIPTNEAMKALTFGENVNRKSFNSSRPFQKLNYFYCRQYIIKTPRQTNI